MTTKFYLSLEVEAEGYRDRETGEVIVTSVTLPSSGKEFRGKELELDDDQLDDVRRELADAIRKDF